MGGVETHAQDGILEITLERPKVNAIDSAASRALGAAFVALRDDPALRVAIVTGGGERFFSAGWDLKAAVAGDTEEWGPGGFAGLTELHDLDKPVIAALNGSAVGGGFELALACDLIVAAAHAEMWLPEVTLGIVADAGGVFRLPRRLPHAVAMEMLLTGRRLSAREAHRLGLVNRVVERPELLPCARELARRVAAGAPLAIAATKAVVRATGSLSLEKAYAALRDGEVPAYDRMRGSEDAREGPRAFALKRPPVWRGR